MSNSNRSRAVEVAAVLTVSLLSACVLAWQPSSAMRDATWVLWAAFTIVALWWAYRLARVASDGPGHGDPATVTDHTRIAARTARDGDQMTAEERDFLGRTTFFEGHPRCPDCGTALLAGPRGGSCVNYACPGCGSRFNCMIYAPSLVSMTVHGERISDAGTPRKDDPA